MIYEFRGILPTGLKAVTAPVAGAELSRIHRERGLTPAALVEESRPEAAVLHGAFEWDDEAAAERYREVQARQIVRAVVICSQPEKGEQAPTIRAFVSLSDPESGPTSRLYKPTIEALDDPVTADEVMRRLRHDLLILRRRYMDMLDVAQMLEVAGQALS